MKKELNRPNSKDLYAKITYEKENNLIYLDWNGYLSVDLVKSGSEELLAVIKETQCQNVLVDNRKVSGPWQAANEWYQTDWNPRAAKAGLANMAVIMSDNIFTQLSLQGFAKVSKGVFTVNVFNADVPARKWLKEQSTAVVK
ncbi:hypothetical protein [Chryseosolibacter indicus]|uniref:STAS/SEC14 domain-containing protein n=1 Tax=Chryseosolibacter indicus TaxID=2782351 RepID=A0ABS5VRH3_9BACT|nr:hypothetical protein [Chryseosolibacter indicus]MBT1704049.1 hypothetical protein [Chryseosolibacter indicus]